MEMACPSASLRKVFPHQMDSKPLTATTRGMPPALVPLGPVVENSAEFRRLEKGAQERPEQEKCSERM